MELSAAVYGGPGKPPPFGKRACYLELQEGGDRVREPRRAGRRFPASERHLQCIWFDPAIRPPVLVSSAGESIEVEHPGIWNLEAGPDFRGAVLRLGPERRRVQGDVEIHIHPAGWSQHGHAADRRYREVRCHVTYYPGTVPEQDLPPGTVQTSLQDALRRNPEFSFDAVDVTAYPYAARAQVPPCSHQFARWTPDAKQHLLDAAGDERLRRKSERFRTRMEQADAGQLLYEEILAALGYKHNKHPFRRLAAAVPLDALRAACGNDALEAYALLAGVCGLLPQQVRQGWDRETRDFVRNAWDRWWRRRESWSGHVMNRSDWRLAGLRPANHPFRRLLAAAQLFTAPAFLEDRWREMAALPAHEALAAAAETLGDIAAPYWANRLGLGGKRRPRPVALLGPSRIHAILANVFVPFCGVVSPEPGIVNDLVEQLPRDDDNEIIRRTAHFLFGPDHSPTLYKTGVRRQGLIQIFHDYCLVDRSRCATCTMPGALEKYGERHPEVLQPTRAPGTKT